MLKMNLQKYFNFLFAVAIAIAIAINFLAIQPTIAQSLSVNREEIIEMVERQARAWESQDVTGIVDDFDSNAVFIAAGFKFEGQQEIAQAARDYFKQFHRTSVEIKRIVVDGSQGAVEWDWRDRERKSNQEGFAEDAIIFELQDGKIVFWREYIEKKKV